MTVCKVCGAPAVEYQSHGQTRSRYRCPEHYNVYMADYQRRKAGCPPGWKVIRQHWLKPPQGVTRVLIDPSRQRVTVYVESRWRTTYFASLKRMGCVERLREFYVSVGYHVVRQSRHAIVLEQDAVSRFIREQRRSILRRSA